MNKNCARLGMQSSFFDSPHGMANQNSRSSAADMARLSAICMEDERFVKITNTKYFKVNSTAVERPPLRSDYVWENTHKMLGQRGVLGIKTGVTQSAGPCLSTALELEQGI